MCLRSWPCTLLPWWRHTHLFPNPKHYKQHTLPVVAFPKLYLPPPVFELSMLSSKGCKIQGLCLNTFIESIKSSYCKAILETRSWAADSQSLNTGTNQLDAALRAATQRHSDIYNGQMNNINRELRSVITETKQTTLLCWCPRKSHSATKTANGSSVDQWPFI